MKIFQGGLLKTQSSGILVYGGGHSYKRENFVVRS
jgi:hypothetical protein